jgi:hypothetical protein
MLVAKPCFEEPYALIALVRVCGGFGKVTSRSYPEEGLRIQEYEQDLRS